jgi:hypothetical protein
MGKSRDAGEDRAWGVGGGWMAEQYIQKRLGLRRASVAEERWFGSLSAGRHASAGERTCLKVKSLSESAEDS